MIKKNIYLMSYIFLSFFYTFEHLKRRLVATFSTIKFRI